LARGRAPIADFFLSAIEAAVVPWRKQAPETTFGLEEARQMALEVVRDPVSICVAVERAHIHNAVADQ
jgi:hypothetical protein